ncbi:MAG: hypothetical protein M3068_08160 [Gemmatimonadota bacterium]|nr:hypothetical protein [Gemmatimonadota bacterium]
MRFAPSLIALALIACSKERPSGGAADSSQAPASTSGGAPAVADRYELNEQNWAKIKAAGLNMDRAEREDTTLRKARLIEEHTTVDGLAASIGREPKLRRAVESAGMSPREQALATFALLGAMAVDADTLAKVKNSVLRSNVQFLTRHGAELEQIISHPSSP